MSAATNNVHKVHIQSFPDQNAISQYEYGKPVTTKLAHGAAVDVTKNVEWSKWNGRESEFSLGFRFDTDKIPGRKHSVTIQYSEFNKALQDALGAKIKKLSFERVHVLSVECTDHHIEFPLSVDIQDHFGVSLNTQTCLKEQKQGNASNIVSLSGPVIFQNNIVPKTLYECNEPLSVDQIRFGDLTTDKITQNVLIVSIGQKSSKFALIPKKPNGVYFYWALTHQNKVFADNVCESPHTRYADDPSVFKLAHQTYLDVVKCF
jgi:hypothetical protein